MPEYRHIQRQFGPVYDENSKILILGSFPSVKSREVNFSTAIRRTASGRSWRACWLRRAAEH